MHDSSLPHYFQQHKPTTIPDILGWKNNFPNTDIFQGIPAEKEWALCEAA